MNALNLEYRKLLAAIIPIKTISTDPAFAGEISKAVAWYKQLFLNNGFMVKVIKGYDNPLIVARYMASPKAETVIIYGHYDVQPADNPGWKSDAFKVTERKGRLYARGTVDNKGQHLMHVAAIFKLIKEKKLNYNVKFLLEGNEETGSPRIGKFLAEYKKLLKADFIMVSDGEVKGDNPLLMTGYRGITNVTLKLKTSTTDLHSGTFGGGVANANQEMANLLAKLYNNDQSINIPGFYADVVKADPKLVANNKTIPFDLQNFKKLSGNQKQFAEKGYDFYSQTALRPTVQVTGIWGGYTGAGHKSVIPGESFAKIHFRLVKGQQPQKVLKQFSKFVEQNLPEYVSYELIGVSKNEGAVEASVLDPYNKYANRAKAVLEDVYGKQLYYMGCGATIPIVHYFSKILKLPIVDAPLVNDDCFMHAANENLSIAKLNKGLEFSYQFFKHE